MYLDLVRPAQNWLLWGFLLKKDIFYIKMFKFIFSNFYFPQFKCFVFWKPVVGEFLLNWAFELVTHAKSLMHDKFWFFADFNHFLSNCINLLVYMHLLIRLIWFFRDFNQFQAERTPYGAYLGSKQGPITRWWSQPNSSERLQSMFYTMPMSIMQWFSPNQTKLTQKHITWQSLVAFQTHLTLFCQLKWRKCLKNAVFELN